MNRGIRNNNPLNIRYARLNDWMGKIVHNSDGEFEQFTMMKWGYRAAIVLIGRYIEKGYNTIATIVHRWAPPKDGNNTTKYVEDVCHMTGIAGHKPIEAGSQDHQAIVKAMAIIESGNDIKEYDRDFNQAWQYYKDETTGKLEREYDSWKRSLNDESKAVKKALSKWSKLPWEK